MKHAGLIVAILLGVYIIVFFLGFKLGKVVGKDSEYTIKCSEKYFTPNSASYLEGIKLDLPEEISQITSQEDKLDLLYGHFDPEENIIYLGFTGESINRNKLMDIDEDSLRKSTSFTRINR